MKIIIKNRLSALLRIKGFRSASEFARRMSEAGFHMSPSHATRFEKADMPAVNLHFINAACNVLQCLPSCLQEIQVDLEENEELDPGLMLPAHAVIRRMNATNTAQKAIIVPAPRLQHYSEVPMMEIE